MTLMMGRDRIDLEEFDAEMPGNELMPWTGTSKSLKSVGEHLN